MSLNLSTLGGVIMQKIILDTSVILYDPEAIFSFKDCMVIIPGAVIEELDKHKRYFDELGKNARKFLRLLDSYADRGDFIKGVKINGCYVQIILGVEGEERVQNIPLSDKRKNKVIQLAYALHKKKEPVTFVTKDMAARISAQTLGIPVSNFHQLKGPYEDYFTGLRTLEVPKLTVDTFLQQGNATLEGNFYPNEYIHLTSAEKSTALGRFNARTEQIETLKKKASGDVFGVKSKNIEQTCALDMLLNDDIPLVSLVGKAGVGKTLLAVACGLRKIFDEDVYRRMIITRPIMPLGKDIGYLPGNKEEKLINWMQPIFDNLEFVCGSVGGNGDKSDSYNWIMDSKKIEMEAITYIRGRSLSQTWIILDEAQNLTPHEIKTIVSRAGLGTKIILTGDIEQIDAPYLDKYSNGLIHVIDKMKEESLYGHMTLHTSERSAIAALAADKL